MRCPTLEELPRPSAGLNGWPWDEATAEQPSAAERLPRISVVMPSLNQGRRLEEGIRSVLLQGYPDLELIVMDGGSSDETLGILHRYAQWIAHWTSAPDRGQSHAINAGMARANGEVLAWIGCDDRYLPGALLRAGRCFAERPDCDWLAGAGVLWFPHADRRGRIESGLDSREALGDFWRFGHRGCFVVQPSTFWRRTLWQAAGGLREDLHFAMDYELWLRFGRRARLHCLDDLLSVALRETGGKTFDHREQQLREILRIGSEFAARSGRGTLPLSADLLTWYVRQRLRACKAGLARRAFGEVTGAIAGLALAPYRLLSEDGRLALLRSG